MIEVLGRRNSANVQKVMWTLGELGVEYVRQDVGGSFGYPENYPNPNQVVPSLHDGDVTVWESNACVRYLARTYGANSGADSLWPEDTAQLALADAWMEWQRSDISNAFFIMFQIMVRGLSGSPDKLQKLIAQSGQCFAQLDEHLADREYVCGEALSFADIAIGAMTYRYFRLDVARPALPHMQAWQARLEERPAYQKHVMIEFGTNLDEWNAHEAANAGIQ